MGVVNALALLGWRLARRGIAGETFHAFSQPRTKEAPAQSPLPEDQPASVESQGVGFALYCGCDGRTVFQSNLSPVSINQARPLNADCGWSVVALGDRSIVNVPPLVPVVAHMSNC
jgi:hypothetical protein